MAHAYPQMRVGFGWSPIVEIADKSGYNPYFLTDGIFYDEFSLGASLLCNLGVVSLGPRIAYFFSSENFSDRQLTKLKIISYGVEGIYNFKMEPKGEWLFPIVISGGYDKYSISMEPVGSYIELNGEGWDIDIKLGIEHFWDKKISLGFLIGRRISSFSNEENEYNIFPKISQSGWRFELLGRLNIKKD